MCENKVVAAVKFFKDWVISSNLRHVKRHSLKKKCHGKAAERWGIIAFLLASNLNWWRA